MPSVITIIVSLSYTLMTQNVLATDIAECLQDEIVQATNSTTVGEMRQNCQTLSNKSNSSSEKPKESNIERRMKSQESAWNNPFILSVYKPNYLFIGQNKNTNEGPFIIQYPDEDVSLDDTEVKFQISIKFPLALDLFQGRGNVFFGYTVRAFWQLFNSNSAPFRETNHEPEVFLSLTSNFNVFGFTNKFINVGLLHQSNGRGGSLSRSWNRIYAMFAIEKDNLVFALKPWIRIPESAEEDDNPDILDYMGNFEFTTVYTLKKHTLSAMVRNNFDFSENRGALQLDWVFPISGYINGYVQYFNGYGESLIDYKYKQESIGVGFALTGWL